jgi:ParB family chromosome partitioning protein
MGSYMKTKGLGAGLGALFGEAAAEDSKNDFEYLPLIRVEPHPEQPRSTFEQDKIDELTDSIREHGVLTPLIVRRIDDGSYQIIAGERRWRAARAAGLDEIPARIVNADDRNTIELALVENLQREDLNPIEEARGFKVLSEDFGMTQADISQRVGKSRPSVANSLRLLSLPIELIEMIESGKLSAGSARALLTLKDSEKMFAAAHKAIEKEMSVREVEALIKDSSSQKKPKRTPKPTVETEIDYILDAQKQLSDALGRRVKIKPEKGGGHIEIDYYNEEDFNALFNHLLHHTQDN